MCCVCCLLGVEHLFKRVLSPAFCHLPKLFCRSSLILSAHLRADARHVEFGDFWCRLCLLGCAGQRVSSDVPGNAQSAYLISHIWALLWRFLLRDFTVPIWCACLMSLKPRQLHFSNVKGSLASFGGERRVILPCILT